MQHVIIIDARHQQWAVIRSSDDRYRVGHDAASFDGIKQEESAPEGAKEILDFLAGHRIDADIGDNHPLEIPLRLGLERTI
jgi:hypothetical protein